MNSKIEPRYNSSIDLSVMDYSVNANKITVLSQNDQAGVPIKKPRVNLKNHYYETMKKQSSPERWETYNSNNSFKFGTKYLKKLDTEESNQVSQKSMTKRPRLDKIRSKSKIVAESPVRKFI